MNKKPSNPYHLQISETIGDFQKVNLSPDHDELFIVGSNGIAITTTSTGTVVTHAISASSTIVGQQRTQDGWQCIYQDNSRLINRRLFDDTYSDIVLETPVASPYTASWSPCGHYVAVGSTGTSLSVWSTRTGELVLRKSISWGDEGDLLTSPTLSVKGWLSTEQKIVTVAEYLAACSIFVWDFDTQGLTAHIE
jgi:WD40 repeat protein